MICGNLCLTGKTIANVEMCYNFVFYRYFVNFH